MTEDEVLALIGGIYDAATDVNRWSLVMQQVADAFGAGDASLSAVSPNAVPWLVAPRSDPEFLQSYGAYYHPLNMFWRRMSRLPVGTVATDEMVMPKEELERSEFYNDWSRPQGYLSVMGATLLVEDDWRIEFVMPGKHGFGPEHLKLYETLAPHLTRAVQINQRLARAEVNGVSSGEALNRLEQGILLLDVGAHLLFANRSAERLFAAGGGLFLQEGILRSDVAAETTALRAVVASCARVGLSDCGGYLTISRGPGRPPLSLLVVPLACEVPWLIHRQPVVMVVIADPETLVQPETSQIQKQYGLTRSEAALVLELLKGDGMQATAERLGIQVATARTHLHRVLAKTGTRRQADLVRLILSSRHGIRTNGFHT